MMPNVHVILSSIISFFNSTVPHNEKTRHDDVNTTQTENLISLNTTCHFPEYQPIFPSCSKNAHKKAHEYTIFMCLLMCIFGYNTKNRVYIALKPHACMSELNYQENIMSRIHLYLYVSLLQLRIRFSGLDINFGQMPNISSLVKICLDNPNMWLIDNTWLV